MKCFIARSSQFAIVLLSYLFVVSSAHSEMLLSAEPSLYLGEAQTLNLSVPTKIKQPLIWQVDRAALKEMDAGEFIVVTPTLSLDGQKVAIQLVAPYISPSFDRVPVVVTGRASNSSEILVQINLQLSVRAELVVRFRQRTENFLLGRVLSEQSDSIFEWDMPLDSKTGEYSPITVNNHKKGLWVRFRYEGGVDQELMRAGGYLMHIYRGEGEYIVHQPFDNDTHLLKSECAFDPITDEQWKSPELGLVAKGQSWANCEFRGFVPAGTAYGFGFREHYLEKESQQKFVQIKNTGELNTELIEYYKFLEESGQGFSAICTSW